MAALVYFSVSIPSSGPSGVRSKFCRCLFILSNPEPNVVKAVVYAKSNQENAGYRHEYERKTCGGGQTRQDRTHRISKSLGTWANYQIQTRLSSTSQYQSVTKLNYQPIAPVHFEELSNIWEKNRRMPTVASRTAWSLARNLNPLNVNNWWYRRKIIAKKFKIKIPGDSYELDVGIPPLVDIKLEELSMPTHAPEAAGSDSTFPNSGSGDELVDLSSSTCVDLIAWKTNSPGDERTPIKGAYIHDSKVSEEVTVASDDTPAPAFCDSSPIPNSPNIWPSSSLPPTSRIASPELDRDLSKESTTSRSDYILVWDHTVSTSIGGRERLDLGIKIFSLHVVAEVIRIRSSRWIRWTIRGTIGEFLHTNSFPALSMVWSFLVILYLSNVVLRWASSGLWWVYRLWLSVLYYT